MYLWLIAMNNL